MSQNKRTIGARYEEAACSYLTENGMHILTRNFRSRQGEVDIIGADEGYLVFVEVKYRKDNSKGMPEEAVTFAKQKRICRTADYYRMKNGYSDDSPLRYDVLAVSGEEGNELVTWYKNAFWHVYR